jgi:hypothetical protein
MANSKRVTVKECIRLNGPSTDRVLFIISKKYAADDVRTPKQWENQLVEDRVIDKPEKPWENQEIEVQKINKPKKTITKSNESE